MRRSVVALAVMLALAGCGSSESPSERNSKAMREDNQAITSLREATLNVARAGLAVERTKPQTKRRRAHEAAVERAIRASEKTP